ncbi:MAG: hypothetical protein QGH70_01645 [Nitrospinota bacterium]|nr:hypothetical protein [Nitrospinota bacterium]MDP6619762.1 hypothetical protein [Nitrospinota bacterium]
MTHPALTAALFLGCFLLRDVNRRGSTRLHTLVEVVAAFLAFGVGAPALVRFYNKENYTPG